MDGFLGFWYVFMKGHVYGMYVEYLSSCLYSMTILLL